jgi:hypothetical protein
MNTRQYSTIRYYYGIRHCFFFVFFSISVRISILLLKTVFYTKTYIYSVTARLLHDMILSLLIIVITTIKV